MSIILIYVTAVLVSIVLERQERRHRFNLEMEYLRLQIPIPPKRPKLPPLESWLNITVGILLLVLGALGLVATLTDVRSSFQDHLNHVAGFIAGGLALVILGVKSLKLNNEYAKQVRSTQTPSSL